MSDRIKELLTGKNIFVILKSSRRYSGIVDDVEMNIVYLTDKFGEPIMFSTTEISSLEIIKDGKQN